MNIFLTGFMGAGKTTFGKALAAVMKKDFLDLDDIIEMEAQKTISVIFKTEGEAAFRRLEREALSTLEAKDAIIATGGGTPCFFDNMNILKRQGITIYLKLPVNQIAKRIGQQDLQRPLLEGRTGTELITFIATKLEEREPYYLQSQVVLDPQFVSPERLATLLLSERPAHG